MPTIRQKKVAKKLVEALQSDEPVTAGEILENIGYSASIVKNPQMIMNSEGVKEELANLGFTIEAADSVVKEILHTGQKEESRLKAADMVYKRLAGYAPDRSMNLNVNVDTKQANPKAAEATQEYHEKLRKSFEE